MSRQPKQQVLTPTRLLSSSEFPNSKISISFLQNLIVLPRDSKYISERRCSIPHFTHLLETVTLLIPLSIPLSIYSRIIPPQNQHGNYPHRNEADLERVPKYILRLIISPVKIAGHSTSQVSCSNVNGHASRSFVATSEVVRHPTKPRISD
jgi:hypothetical protein